MKKLLFIAAALLGLTSAAKMHSNMIAGEQATQLSLHNVLTLTLVTVLPVVCYLLLLLW